MPEGPEHHLAARYVNSVAGDRVFGGQPVRSDVVVASGQNKHPDLRWSSPAFTIVACARGKEVKLSLAPVTGSIHVKRMKVPLQMLDVYFQFGMSGYFRMTTVDDIPKHSHLRFLTCDTGNPEVLNFVDARRFGRWRGGGGWSSDRGPDPLFEYSEFRETVLKNLEKSIFNRAICEVMLNQQYFNGIGNYMRAEVLFRGGVLPFDCARDVLSHLPLEDNLEIKSENPDILRLCHIVGNEVLSLNKGKAYDLRSEADYEEFTKYLQCYGKPIMNNLTDSNGRTIWFSGKPGKMVPAKAKSVQRHSSKRDAKANVSEVTDNKFSSAVSKATVLKRRTQSSSKLDLPLNISRGPITRSKSVAQL